MHDVYPTVAKYYLQKRGLQISTFTRRTGIGEFNAEVKAKVDQLFEDYASLKERVNLDSVLA